MNAQQIPGPLGEHQVFRTLNKLPIHWHDRKRGVTHLCEGSDVHPGVRLLWTLCERDVPADAAHLPTDPAADPITCASCAARAA